MLSPENTISPLPNPISAETPGKKTPISPLPFYTVYVCVSLCVWFFFRGVPYGVFMLVLIIGT